MRPARFTALNQARMDDRYDGHGQLAEQFYLFIQTPLATGMLGMQLLTISLAKPFLSNTT